VDRGFGGDTVIIVTSVFWARARTHATRVNRTGTSVWNARRSRPPFSVRAPTVLSNRRRPANVLTDKLFRACGNKIGREHGERYAENIPFVWPSEIFAFFGNIYRRSADTTVVRNRRRDSQSTLGRDRRIDVTLHTLYGTKTKVVDTVLFSI